MPRKQARQRALHRLSNRIIDIVFNGEFIEAVIKARAKLGIDIKTLKEKASTEYDTWLGSRPQDPLDLHANVGTRIAALADFLIERRLIGRYSSQALRSGKIYPDSKRFWQIIGEARDIDWPDYYCHVPYYYVVGGLCFDVTECCKKYEKTAFRDTINRSLEMNGSDWKIRASALDLCPIDNLEEYAYFWIFVRYVSIESKLLRYDNSPFKTVDAWRKYICNDYTLDESSVYLDITDLFLDDIELNWIDLIIAKEQVGAFEYPPIGRTKGVKRSRKSGLRNLTWEQIREKVRENPRQINVFENAYVNERGKSNPIQRGKAIKNFYKQVIGHRSMLDLKLQIRKRGRPRKTEDNK
jgi:hypothetical protein